LDEYRAHRRFNPNSQIIEDDFPDVKGNVLDKLWLGFGRQRMQVGNDEEGFLFVLEANPVRERTYIMPEVQASRWAIAGEETGFGLSCHKYFLSFRRWTIDYGQ